MKNLLGNLQVGNILSTNHLDFFQNSSWVDVYDITEESYMVEIMLDDDENLVVTFIPEKEYLSNATNSDFSECIAKEEVEEVLEDFSTCDWGIRYGEEVK